MTGLSCRLPDFGKSRCLMIITETPALVSIVLPVAAHVPARYAVPVEVRNTEGSLLGLLVTDGRYHPVPPGYLTFIAVLPQGQLFQVSAELWADTSTRITLQGDVRSLSKSQRTYPTLLDRQSTALRFYAQSSIDTCRRLAGPVATAAMAATIDEVRLRLTTNSRSVQFIRLLPQGLLPINIAHAGEAIVKIFDLERTLAADLVVLDERVELAYEYLRDGWTEKAVTTLDLQNIASESWLAAAKPAEALVCLHILLGAKNEYPVEDMALRMTQIHPNVADFHIISAECAARRNDDTAALQRLTHLRHAGLPLLYRSYAQATVRLARHAPFVSNVSNPGAELSSAPFDQSALLTIHERLQQIKSYVDPASSLLVIRGPTPERPAASLSVARKLTLWFARATSRYQLRLDKPREERRLMTTDPGTSTPSSLSTRQEVDRTVTTSDRGSPSRLALAAAVIALIIWIGFAVYLVIRSGAAEVEWTRIAWVFSSVGGAIFAAAGLVVGMTVNRQRAERAEAQAGLNQRDAESGRALAAALKADDPPVVHEGRTLGQDQPDSAAIQIAGRHARLARELFP
jgi:hypothetical protein